MPANAFSTARSVPVCKTSCDIPSSSDATASCSPHVAAGLDRAMSSLRSCLTTIGASEVDPIILATYAHDGALSSATIDLGGIEAAQCVARARAVLPVRTADASGMLRCSQRCTAVE